MISRRTLEERLPDLLERGAPQPPRDLNGASIRAASIRAASTRAALAQMAPARSHHRLAWRWAAPTVAAVIVIVVAVTLALLPGTHDRDRSSAIHPGGIAALNMQRRADTASALNRLLAAFSTPSTWHASTRSLSRDLAVPRDDTTTYLVSRARLWTTTDAANSAMAYVSSHLPRDVSAGNAVNQTPNFASALFTPGEQWSRSTDYAGMSISVVMERLRSGTVGVEIEASAYWLPLRTPAQTIPASVTGAAVTIRSAMPAKILHRGNLNVVNARALAREINRLPVTYQAPSLCPVPGPSATLTFTSPVGPRRVTASSYCPSGVFVQPRTPGMQIDLAEGRIFATVLSMLNLPAHFAHR